jgi:hypothetical protein
MGRQIEVVVHASFTVDTCTNDIDEASKRAKAFVAEMLENATEPAGYDDIQIVWEPEFKYDAYNRGGDDDYWEE